MQALSNIPFLEHPLENWLFIIALAIIAVGLNIFLLIRSRRKPGEPPKKTPDDVINPWESMEKENIARKKK